MAEWTRADERVREEAREHLRRFLDGGRNGGTGSGRARRNGADVSLHWADEDRYYVAAGESGDEFIHQDLGGFLRRELDAYISTTLLQPSEVAAASAAELERRCAVVRALQQAAGEVIDALAAEEERRKRRWLRKRLVRVCSYLLSLDRVPEGFYPEIATNDRQREAWVRLFAIDALGGYARPLTVEFLRANPGLVVDTALYPEDFGARLIAALPQNLEEAISGILVAGDNFQALALLSRRFAGAIDCAYIDPPYNTGGQAFAYKDSFRHSAWLSLLDTRLAAFFPLAAPAGTLFVSIDDNEVGNLCNLVRRRAPAAELVTLVAVQSNPRGRRMDKYLAKTHEYVAVFAVHGSGGAIRPVEKDPAAQAEYDRADERGRYRLLELRNRNPAFGRANRPNLFFPLYARAADGAVSLERTAEHGIEVWPRNSRGVDGCWRWSARKVAENLELLVARAVRTGGWRIFAKDHLQKHDGQIATTKAKSIWLDRELNNELGKESLHHLFGEHVFDFPKPPALVAKCAAIGMGAGGWFADFFAGSGTSGQAILDLNRGGGERRFVLVENGAHFDDVLVPRVLKAAYSPAWKAGRPLRRDGHLSVMLKCLRLEEGEADQDSPEGQRGDVDRVETFNWLLGLRVERIGATQRDPTGELWFRTVSGWLPREAGGTGESGRERVLIIWRGLTGDRDRDDAALKAWFNQIELTERRAYDVIYVNGPNNLEALRRPGEAWRVESIDEQFERLREPSGNL